ncbi:hypothetical protein [Ramlibacter sp. AN1133]|uniref:hypothetical protein n=1 Tax=Ramlibacter sp. AN1133 TaxID=3133429 RepID=UPI0030BE181B
MQASDLNLAALAPRAVSEPVAGVLGGIVAGTAYLVAQVTLTAAAHPGGAAEPLQRIAAMLMGPDAAPPPSELSFTVFGMALIIHFTLAMVFGRLVAVLVGHRRPGTGVLVGAATGLALYALDFGLVAPLAFPWFADSIRAVTLADHVLFGAVAAGVCIALRRPAR